MTLDESRRTVHSNPPSALPRSQSPDMKYVCYCHWLMQWYFTERTGRKFGQRQNAVQLTAVIGCVLMLLPNSLLFSMS
jgi:hypothetical protein